jgi:hypothetical protein
MENIGPLENHVFTISVDKSTSYYDKMPVHLLSGMKGKFEVVTGNDTAASSVASIPGPSPEIQGNGNDNDGEISFVGGGK